LLQKFNTCPPDVTKDKLFFKLPADCTHAFKGETVGFRKHLLAYHLLCNGGKFIRQEAGQEDYLLIDRIEEGIAVLCNMPNIVIVDDRLRYAADAALQMNNECPALKL